MLLHCPQCFATDEIQQTSSSEKVFHPLRRKVCPISRLDDDRPIFRDFDDGLDQATAHIVCVEPELTVHEGEVTMEILHRPDILFLIIDN